MGSISMTISPDVSILVNFDISIGLNMLTFIPRCRQLVSFHQKELLIPPYELSWTLGYLLFLDKRIAHFDSAEGTLIYS